MEFFECKNCGGTGIISVGSVEVTEITSISSPYKMFIPGMIKRGMCENCNGTGKIDWIQKIRKGE